MTDMLHSGLSRGALAGLVLQTVAIAAGGVAAFNSVNARIAVVETRQIDGERVAKLEAKMESLQHSVERLQRTLDRRDYGSLADTR